MSKKDTVKQFDLDAAFKALNELEMPVVRGGIRPQRENLTERFSKTACSHTDALLEEYFDVNDQDELVDAKDMREDEIAKAKLARIEKIVDLDAESPEDIQPSYVGKIIVQCPQCMTLFYREEADLEPTEEDPKVVNVGEACQHCGNVDGYNIIGGVQAVEDMAQDVTEEEPVEEPAAEEAEEEEPAEEPAEEAVEETTEETELEEIPVEEVEEETQEESFNMENNKQSLVESVTDEDIQNYMESEEDFGSDLEEGILDNIKKVFQRDSTKHSAKEVAQEVGQKSKSETTKLDDIIGKDGGYLVLVTDASKIASTKNVMAKLQNYPTTFKLGGPNKTTAILNALGCGTDKNNKLAKTSSGKDWMVKEATYAQAQKDARAWSANPDHGPVVIISAKDYPMFGQEGKSVSGRVPGIPYILAIYENNQQLKLTYSWANQIGNLYIEQAANVSHDNTQREKSNNSVRDPEWQDVTAERFYCKAGNTADADEQIECGGALPNELPEAEKQAKKYSNLVSSPVYLYGELGDKTYQVMRYTKGEADEKNYLANFNSFVKAAISPVEEVEEVEDIEVEESLDTTNFIEDLEENSLNEHVSNYLTNLYENVAGFQATACMTTQDGNLIVEGIISFTNGNTNKTRFTFKPSKLNENYIAMVGINETFAKESAFKLLGKIQNNYLITESLSYKYKIGDTTVSGKTLK